MNINFTDNNNVEISISFDDLYDDYKKLAKFIHDNSDKSFKFNFIEKDETEDKFEKLRERLNILHNDVDCNTCDEYRDCHNITADDLDSCDIEVLCLHDDKDVCELVDKLTDDSIATCSETVELLTRHNMPFEFMVVNYYNGGDDIICDYYTLDRSKVLRSSDDVDDDDVEDTDND